jgi:hypothetical protein
MAGEYCWAITRQQARSCCGLSGPGVMTFVTDIESRVHTLLYITLNNDHKYTHFQLALEFLECNYRLKPGTAYIPWDWDSSVGTATRYRLDDPGIESRRGEETFRTRPARPRDPPSLLYNGCCVFAGGKAAGAWC